MISTYPQGQRVNRHKTTSIKLSNNSMINMFVSEGLGFANGIAPVHLFPMMRLKL